MVNQVDPWSFQNSAFREPQAPTSLTATATWDVFARLAGLEHHHRIGGEHTGARYQFDHPRNGGLTWRPGERFDPPFFDPGNPATWRVNGVITSTWGGEVHLDSKVQTAPPGCRTR